MIRAILRQSAPLPLAVALYGLGGAGLALAGWVFVVGLLVVMGGTGQ